MNYEDNDYELLYLISENNESAKEIFYDKYKPTVEVKARKYFQAVKGNGIELNDLIQEGMIGLSNAISDYQEQKNIKFSTFAATCIERNILTYIRRISCNKHMVLNNSLSMDASLSTYDKPLKDFICDEENLNPENVFIRNEDEVEIDRLINEILTEQERDVFLLRADGFSYNEIASLLNMTKKSVERSISRARNKIEKFKQNN